MPIKTRHQRQIAEQDGTAPSPPRMLADPPRARRTRVQKSSATPSSSAKAGPSTSKDTGRNTQRGRTRGGRRAAHSSKPTQDDTAEISEESTQQDVSAQSDASTQAEGSVDPPVDVSDGEIPTSLLGTATHPVSVSPPLDSQQSKAKAESADAGNSRSSLTAHPVHDTEEVSVSPSAAHPVHGNEGLFPSPRVSPAVTISAPVDTQRPEVASASFSNPGSNLTATKEFISAETQTSPSHVAPEREVPNVLDDVPEREIPNVLNLPSSHEKPYSFMQVFVDSHPPTDMSTKPSKSLDSVGFAIPTEQLPYLFALAGKLNPLLKDMRNDPVVDKVVRESRLTRAVNVAITTTRIRSKRVQKAIPLSFVHMPQDVPVPPYTNIAQSASKQSMRDPESNECRFMSKPGTAKRRLALEKSEANGSPQKRSRSGIRIGVRKVPDPIDEDGRAALGRFRDVPVEIVDDENTIREEDRNFWISNKNPYTNEEVPGSIPQPPQAPDTGSGQHEIVPETPRTRGWGLSSFIPSAQTVSKFIPVPFSSRRAPSADTNTSKTDVKSTQHKTTVPVNESETDSVPPMAKQPLEIPHWNLVQPQAEDLNGPSRMRSPDLIVSSTRTESSSAPNPWKRRYAAQLLTRGEAQEYHKLKKEKAKLRAKKAKLEEEEARIAQEKKALQEERAKVQATHAAAQIPGGKRKRPPSPDVIPNPPGGGFGMNLDYFPYDSSDEEDEDEEGQDTPTKPRPRKKARTSSSSNTSTGNDRSASPYEGTRFDVPEKSSPPSAYNPFRRSAAARAAQAQQHEAEITSSKQDASDVTPSKHPGRFTVPSPSDDSDDDEEDEEDDSIPPHKRFYARHRPDPNRERTGPLAIWANATREGLNPLACPTASAPASTPSDSPKPPANTPRWVDPVERARSQALKHQPAIGSRLRESSRLSTSTVGSEKGDNDAIEEADSQAGAEAEPKETEYDPRRPALPASFVRSQQQKTNFGAEVSPITRALETEDVSSLKDTSSAANLEGIRWAYPEFGKTLSDKVREEIADTNEARWAYPEFEKTMSDKVREEIVNKSDFDGYYKFTRATYFVWKVIKAREEKEALATAESAASTYQREELSSRVRACLDQTFDEDKFSGSDVDAFKGTFKSWRASEVGA